jgi:hypothetical protein
MVAHHIAFQHQLLKAYSWAFGKWIECNSFYHALTPKGSHKWHVIACNHK